jgi:hypothetical protein
MADDVPGTKKVPCSTEIPFVLQVNKKEKGKIILFHDDYYF